MQPNSAAIKGVSEQIAKATEPIAQELGPAAKKLVEEAGKRAGPVAKKAIEKVGPVAKKAVVAVALPAAKKVIDTVAKDGAKTAADEAAKTAKRVQKAYAESRSIHTMADRLQALAELRSRGDLEEPAFRSLVVEVISEQPRFTMGGRLSLLRRLSTLKRKELLSDEQHKFVVGVIVGGADGADQPSENTQPDDGVSS